MDDTNKVIHAINMFNAAMELLVDVEDADVILGDMSTSIDYMTEIVNDNEDYDMTDVILVDEDYL